MGAREIVEVVGELVLDDGAGLERERGPQALAVARRIEAALVPYVAANPGYAALWQQFRAAPRQQAPILAGLLQVVLSADAALARRMDDLLAQYRRAAGASGTRVHTGGGAYISGSVSTGGGDFVGRDQTVVKHAGVGAEQVAALFEQALGLARQKPPPVREDLEAAVETAQEETGAGDDADKRLLSKALDVLLDKGPDVLEIVLDAILNPAAAAGKGAKMLAKQARRSLQHTRKTGS